MGPPALPQPGKRRRLILSGPGVSARPIATPHIPAARTNPRESAPLRHENRPPRHTGSGGGTSIGSPIGPAIRIDRLESRHS